MKLTGITRYQSLADYFTQAKALNKYWVVLMEGVLFILWRSWAKMIHLRTNMRGLISDLWQLSNFLTRASQSFLYWRKTVISEKGGKRYITVFVFAQGVNFSPKLKMWPTRLIIHLQVLISENILVISSF